MAFAALLSRAQLGLQAPTVTVEVLLSGGLPRFSIVGLAETAVRESKDRVRGAILTSGFDFPQRRITVSLGPADLRKSGGRFDLAIALGILAASGQVAPPTVGEVEFYGELALDGCLKPVRGLLPAAIQVRSAARTMIVPGENAAESVLAKARVYAASSLLQVAAHLNGTDTLKPAAAQEPIASGGSYPDLADVRGQPLARRALEIAAAGGHNLLLIGPPGTGKSMLARRLPGILPPLTDEEALESAAVESVLGLGVDVSTWRQRRFRCPHHTATGPALIGGGSDPSPGEISRAHCGVLFLDELPEWNRQVLETLREPMESGIVHVARAVRQAEFPARFQLVAAMNPCPCGYLRDDRGSCHCSKDAVASYRRRISGPLLDRIDMSVNVPRPPPSVLRPGARKSECTLSVRRRVEAAREIQVSRAGTCNAWLDGAAFERDCMGEESALRLLETYAEKHSLSVRAQRRVLRVARTIADLAGSNSPQEAHVAESLSLRTLG